MQYDTHERNGCACIQRTAALQRNIQHLIDILPSVSIALFAHDTGHIFSNRCEEFLSELLSICTVVRFVLIKVRVEGAADGRKRNIGVLILQITLREVTVEVGECRGRNAEREVRNIRLQGCIVFTKAGITVVDRLNNVAIQFQTVKGLAAVDICKVEVGIYIEALLFCVSNQICKSVRTAGGFLPSELIRNGGIHTAVCVTGQFEVNVGDTCCCKLIKNSRNILKRGHRLADGGRYGKHLLNGIHSTESLDGQRDIVIHIFIGQRSERAVFEQVVTVSLCHAHPSGLVILLNVVFLSDRRIGQHDVLNGEAADILTVRNNFDIAGRANGKRIGQFVSVLRSGVKGKLNRVVVVQLILMLSGDSGERIALFDDR